MKIAHIVSTFPPQIGGMSQVAYEECLRLGRRGYDVTVFTLRHPGQEPAATRMPVRIVRLLPLLKAGDAGWVPQLVWALKGFDVAHLHYPFYGGAEWVWLSSRLRGLKYILTYHMDARSAGLRRVVQKLYDKMFPRHIIASAKAIITVDVEHFRQSDWGQAARVAPVEILNGVDADTFKPQTVTLTGMGLPELADKKILLFVGNPLPFKRLDWLLQALQRLSADTVLVVVSGEYKVEKYKKLTRTLGIAQRVRFVGRAATAADLARYYSLAQCLVVPSQGTAESFSLVAAEAQASGCPVVVSNSPGMRNRVRDGVDGFLFEANSLDDLIGCLKKMLDVSAEERRAMGERGRARALELYSWQTHVDKLEQVYANVIRL